MTDGSIAALSVNQVELSDGRIIPPGTEFDCPAANYDELVAMRAITAPDDAPKARRRRGRKAVAASEPAPVEPLAAIIPNDLPETDPV